MIRWFFRVTISLAQSIFMYNVKILDPQLYLKGPQTANHHIPITSKTSSKKPFTISLTPSSLVLNYVTSTSVFRTSILVPASPRHQPESGTQSQHIHISLYKRNESPKSIHSQLSPIRPIPSQHPRINTSNAAPYQSSGCPPFPCNPLSAHAIRTGPRKY